jgi:hypothetical protein
MTMDKDLEHLKLLSIFYYIVGGLACFCGLLWIVYIVAGVILVVASGSMASDDRMGASIGGVAATIVVLNRPSVRALFQGLPAIGTASPPVS